MDDRAIARWRIHTQRLAGEPYADPATVVDGLLGVQAENRRQAAFAVATRTVGTDEASFDRLADDGVVLRTHVLRPTWHFVRPADIRWLIELTAPRVRSTFAQIQRQLDVDDAALDLGASVIVAALSGGVALTREEIADHLGEAGLSSEGQRLGLHLAHAELACLICSGPMSSTKHSYALLEERAPDARRLDRDEAIVELVLRYFTGHGPATERDLAYWATMTLTDVRRGLAEVADQLQRLDHDGRTYWYGKPPPEGDNCTPRAHLLLTLDEYHNGYQDSRHVLDAAGIVPRGRGANVGMVLVDGQMVGNARRTIGTEEVRFAIGAFRDLDGRERDAIEEAADRHGRFLGLRARIEVAPSTR